MPASPKPGKLLECWWLTAPCLSSSLQECRPCILFGRAEHLCAVVLGCPACTLESMKAGRGCMFKHAGAASSLGPLPAAACRMAVISGATVRVQFIVVQSHAFSSTACSC